jgi:phosphate transport system substrate-binding protein
MVTISPIFSPGPEKCRRLVVGVCSALFLAISANASATQDQSAAGEPTGVPHGGGSTFVQPLLAAWAAVYKEEARTDVEYRAVGSSQGLTELHSGSLDFGAVDQPLTSAELAEGKLSQFPVAVGAVVLAVNVAGVKSGDLHFNGPLLADIFAGKITKWNDPAIALLNPAVILPKASITTVHRADSSGTTYNFTHYLSQVSPSWKKRFGEGQVINWTGGIAAVGNGSVADAVGKIANSIGYTEYAYVLTHDLTYACLQDSGGHVICPSVETFANAVEKTAWSGAGDFDMAVINTPTARSYPIMATTFIVMPKDAKDKPRSDAALRFFLYGLEKGQDEAKALHYVPLPPQLVSQIRDYINAKIK